MSKSLEYRISPDVFTRFPVYKRGVVFARGVQNHLGDDQIRDLLRSTEDDVRKTGISVDDMSADIRFTAWRDAFREQGIKPSQHRPSVEALVRRVLRDQELPSISSLVDVGTVASLKYFVPIGGHSVDDVHGDIALRLADGDETFVPFGMDELENPSAGEIILTDGPMVMTRRWVWRQANHSLVTPDTRNLFFNVDVLFELGTSEIGAICENVGRLVQAYCGGTCEISIMDSSNPSVTLIY